MTRAAFCKVFYCQKCGKVMRKSNNLCKKHRDELEHGKCKTCNGPLLTRKQGKFFCSINCKNKMVYGKLNPNYKDGRKDLKLRIRQLSKPNPRDVFEADGYRCKKCGVLGGRLEADHITPFSSLYEEFMKNNKNISDDEAFLRAKNFRPFFNILNFQTLCRACNMEKFNKFEVQICMDLTQ